jgi:predicted DNA-binding transcriptional regulator YafY
VRVPEWLKLLFSYLFTERSDHLLDEINTKQRLLKLIDILKMSTDEEHEMTLNQIVDQFHHLNKTNVGTKGIKDDIKELVDSGLFDITVNQAGPGLPKYYSHQYRLFEIHELRMLVDAVSSAKFITQKESEKIVDKIKKLTSAHLARQLENRLLFDENIKSTNDQIKNYIHEIHRAIIDKRSITFQYGRYNVSKEFVLSRNGNPYEIRPYALIWNNDYYYLIGEYIETGEIRHYRVDRMSSIKMTNDKFIYKQGFGISKYVNQLFHMYSGEEQDIQIQFNNQLINVIIDRFGLNVSIKADCNQTFVLSTMAILSDGLIKWILTWGSDAKVLYPSSLVERLKIESEKLYKQYH